SRECSNCSFFSSRRRHTRSKRDWSSDVCSSDLDRFNPGLDISVFFICLFKPDSPAISSRLKRSIKLFVVNIGSPLLIFLLKLHMSLSYQKGLIIYIKKYRSPK